MGCAVDMKTEKNEVKGKVEGEAGGGKREMPDSLFLETEFRDRIFEWNLPQAAYGLSDSELLRQVLYNLLGNTMRHGPRRARRLLLREKRPGFGLENVRSVSIGEICGRFQTLA